MSTTKRTVRKSLPVVEAPQRAKPLSFAEMVRASGPYEGNDGGGSIIAEIVAPQVPFEAVVDVEWHGGDLQTLNAPPPSMIQVIQGVMQRRREERRWFRPSGFGGCRRSQVFFYLKTAEEPPQPDDTLSMILETGTALHSMVQRWLAEHPGVFFVPEVPVWLPELEIQGSSDGLLMFRRADKYGSIYRWGFELKTIGPSGFDALSKPKPEHVVQATIYAKLMGVQWITILYYCKGTSRLKEFHVQVDEGIWEQVKERVAYLKDHIHHGTLPEYDSKECRNSINLCRYVRYCHDLEGKNPPMTWGGNK